MQYTIEAKPTIYNGRLYRSRLEARVACFMDLRGIRYEYEPFDLEGWSPDFLSFYSSESKSELNGSLVEVKPDYKMFDIRKYIKVDFDKYSVTFFCPQFVVMISKEEVLSVELEHGDSQYIRSWKEAANKVMFLKPKI